MPGSPYSCQRARSWLYVPRISSAQTPCLGVVATRGVAGEGEAGLAPTVALPRPYGRPRSFMPTRSFMVLRAPDFLRADSTPRGGGRRGASPVRARQCLAPTVALGHSCQRARSWLYVPRISSAQTPCLGVVGDAGRRRMRARQCLAPTVALGHSCQRARSWLYVPRISSAQTPRLGVVGDAGRRR